MSLVRLRLFRFPARSLFLLFFVAVSGVVLAGCSNLPWQKQFSGLQVKMTDGTVAQVYLDGLHLGQTPLEKRSIRPGTYTFRLESNDSGKQPYETQIHLYPNTFTSVLWNFRVSEIGGAGDILELEPLASKDRAELSVITVPEGANISLDTTSYGLSPVIVDSVAPGTYDLSIDAVAHVEKAIQVQIQPGSRLHVFSRLAKEAGALGTESSEDTSAGRTAEQGAELSPPEESSGQGTAAQPDTQGAPSARRQLPPENPEPVQLQPPYVVIGSTPTGWLRVRSEPSSSGAEVARVEPEEKYPYKSTENGWYEIEYASGQLGWISGQYADIIR